MKRGGPLRRKAKSPLSKLKQQLWDECKRIVRARYANKDGTWNCYTCGALITEPKNAHTGHFISSSVCSTELRYDLGNLRVQDYACNVHRSGNWIAFEERLVKEHGAKYITELKKRNQATKGLMYRIDWYEAKLQEYKKL